MFSVVELQSSTLLSPREGKHQVYTFQISLNPFLVLSLPFSFLHFVLLKVQEQYFFSSFLFFLIEHILPHSWILKTSHDYSLFIYSKVLARSLWQELVNTLREVYQLHY